MTSAEIIALSREQPDPRRYYENTAPLGQKPNWVVRYYPADPSAKQG
jgi:hypothetical protein